MVEATALSMVAYGNLRVEGGVWRCKHARKFHDRMGYSLRRVEPHAAVVPCWGEGRALMAKLSGWSKVLDAQLHSLGSESLSGRAVGRSSCGNYDLWANSG